MKPFMKMTVIITLLDQMADNNDTKWFDKITLKEAIEELDERERLIVYLRYYKDQTQSEVAGRLGISQVQVSRLEKNLTANERTHESMIHVFFFVYICQ